MILLLVPTDKGPGIYLSESTVKFIVSLKLFSKTILIIPFRLTDYLLNLFVSMCNQSSIENSYSKVCFLWGSIIV